MVDIKPFVNRILNQIKAGRKAVVQSEKVIEGESYFTFSVHVDRNTMSETFFENFPKTCQGNFEGRPCFLLSKVETGVFIHLLKLKENKDEDSTVG